MEISSSTVSSQLPSMSILKSANQQPELAGELIAKTVESLLQATVVQANQQSVGSLTGIGTVLDIVA